ncbi:MAG TPA: hypothetical protein VLV16_14775 [Gemmatimonadales bacterium]|nr:hypothetical protein [Gemmatimonadales bacterium]
MHDRRREFLGMWSLELLVDSVDVFVLDGSTTRSVAHRARKLAMVGSLHVLDSLTPDREAVYARAGGQLLSLICYKADVIMIGLARKGESASLMIPPYMPIDARYPENLFARGHYYGDSIVGTWGETCNTRVDAEGLFRKYDHVLTEGRFRMVRASPPN